MNYDWGKNNEPYATASISLKTVMNIQADRSYDVQKGTGYRTIVIWRTISGRGKIEIDGLEDITVQADTLLFANYNDVRRYYCDGDKWDFWWFEFYSNDVINLPLNSLLYMGQVENETAECQSCLELIKNADVRKGYLASAQLNLLIYKWLLYMENKNTVYPHNQTVQKAIDYMKLNLDTNISINSVAKSVGLCEKRFREVFTSVTGTQPKKYIENIKMHRAAELLRNTSLQISEISDMLGFSSPFHFCKAFRKWYAVTPTQYKKSGSGVTITHPDLLQHFSSDIYI